jgi:anti-sigma regulatory factor (Ser/Thr protein kinase)
MHSEDDEALVAADPIPDLRCADIPATSDRLFPLRHSLAGWIAKVGLDTDLTDAITLATDEAMSNVVSHAYPHHPGTFELHAEHRPAEGILSVTVRDRGRWRPEPADPGPLHGRGLVLIRALAHDVVFEQETDGTTVRMVWRLPD